MLIVIEGLDSSGKATHTEYLYRYYKNRGENVKKVTFPDYDSPASAPVKMYLSGDLGSNADDVSPYAASAFFAVDRFVSHVLRWGQFLKDGGIVIADRYVTSNMVHQAAKIEDLKEKDKFLDWLCDFEYNKLELPVPEAVIFLDMPPEAAEALMAQRANKFTGAAEKDIHERNRQHLKKAYDNALYVAEKSGWHLVKCTENKKIRPLDDIQKDIVKITDGEIYGF